MDQNFFKLIFTLKFKSPVVYSQSGVSSTPNIDLCKESLTFLVSNIMRVRFEDFIRITYH